MGEIDHADDAENHRVADGDEAVDRAERQPVDQLLQEIVHALPHFTPFTRRSHAGCMPRQYAPNIDMRHEPPGSLETEELRNFGLGCLTIELPANLSGLA